MAASAAFNGDLDISGAELGWYSPDDDPNVAYGFCNLCGSSLFYRSGIADGTNETTSVCAGSIDGRSGLTTTEVWFAGNAADHEHLPHGPAIFDTEPPRS
jgi:hypothetical protein